MRTRREHGASASAREGVRAAQTDHASKRAIEQAIDRSIEAGISGGGGGNDDDDSGGGGTRG